MYGGYATLSLGYIGIYEATLLTKGCSHTAPEGKRFAHRIMDEFNAHIKRWKEETNIALPCTARRRKT